MHHRSTSIKRVPVPRAIATVEEPCSSRNRTSHHVLGDGHPATEPHQQSRFRGSSSRHGTASASAFLAPMCPEGTALQPRGHWLTDGKSYSTVPLFRPSVRWTVHAATQFWTPICHSGTTPRISFLVHQHIVEGSEERVRENVSMHLCAEACISMH
jgi:hypothetical protein